MTVLPANCLSRETFQVTLISCRWAKKQWGELSRSQQGFTNETNWLFNEPASGTELSHSGNVPVDRIWLVGACITEEEGGYLGSIVTFLSSHSHPTGCEISVLDSWQDDWLCFKNIPQCKRDSTKAADYYSDTEDVISVLNYNLFFTPNKISLKSF